jgi:nucleotide-binding universal stress UspA family protein
MTDSAAPLQNVDEGLRQLIVAIDASAEAPRVVAASARFVRPFPEAVVHLVHVFRVSRFDRARVGVPAPDGDALAEAKDYLDAQARSLRRQCRNQVVPHLPVGDPCGEVLKLAESFRADLLVVGTHDHTGFERLLLGSIAEDLTRKAPCSIVVVRRPHYRS